MKIGHDRAARLSFAQEANFFSPSPRDTRPENMAFLGVLLILNQSRLAVGKKSTLTTFCKAILTVRRRRGFSICAAACLDSWVCASIKRHFGSLVHLFNGTLEKGLSCCCYFFIERMEIGTKSFNVHLNVFCVCVFRLWSFAPAKASGWAVEVKG